LHHGEERQRVTAASFDVVPFSPLSRPASCCAGLDCSPSPKAPHSRPLDDDHDAVDSSADEHHATAHDHNHRDHPDHDAVDSSADDDHATAHHHNRNRPDHDAVDSSADDDHATAHHNHPDHHDNDHHDTHGPSAHVERSRRRPQREHVWLGRREHWSTARSGDLSDRHQVAPGGVPVEHDRA
jgi:hypothetical protein